MLVARIVADFAQRHHPAREAAWIAELQGERVGCIFCVATEDRVVAQLRILLVTRGARKLGVGTLLIDQCLRFARDAGYRVVTLWTNDVLVSARRIYEAAGFTRHDQQAHHSFGHDLVDSIGGLSSTRPTLGDHRDLPAHSLTGGHVGRIEGQRPGDILVDSSS